MDKKWSNIDLVKDTPMCVENDVLLLGVQSDLDRLVW